MYPTINLEKIKGSQLGKGAEKVVYRHNEYPDRCIKICSKNNTRSIIREIEYFKFLDKHQIKASFIPKFYEAFECDTSVGYIQESFVDKQNGGSFDSVSLLYNYIINPDSDLSEVLKMLGDLKNEMIHKNIIISDLHAWNFFRVVENGRARLVIVDGYGSPEILPLPQYIRFLGKLKIERQWEKLYRRLEPIIQKKSQITNRDS